MYRIGKVVKISAAHRLLNLPLEHPCYRPHGHNYKVEVELEALELHEGLQWVEDFGVISGLIKEYDHQDLNILLGNSPTAEVFAKVLHARLTELLNPRTGTENYQGPPRRIRVVKVRVWETDDSWAEVS